MKVASTPSPPSSHGNSSHNVRPHAATARSRYSVGRMPLKLFKTATKALIVFLAVLSIGMALVNNQNNLLAGRLALVNSTTEPSRREQALGISLPFPLPRKFLDYVDARQFPEYCNGDTRASIRYPQYGAGLGAELIHGVWEMIASMVDWRTTILADPDRNFSYTLESNCSHGLLCAIHPISGCFEAQVDAGGPGADFARKATGRVFGWYGKLVEVQVPPKNVRQNPAKNTGPRVVNTKAYWEHSPHGTCVWTHYVPPEFRTIGTDLDWNDLRRDCNFSAFDKYGPDGLDRASKNLFDFRAGIFGYLFQPLPWVLELAEKKRNRIGMLGSDCVTIFVRRGDKVKVGESPAHSISDYLDALDTLCQRVPCNGNVFLSSDALPVVLDEWKRTDRGKKWNLRVDRLDMNASGLSPGGRDYHPENRRPGLQELGNAMASIIVGSDCPNTIGALESWYYQMVIYLGQVRGIYNNSQNMNGAKPRIGQRVQGRHWRYFFLP